MSTTTRRRSYHPGRYAGGHTIDANTAKIFVAELRTLASRADAYRGGTSGDGAHDVGYDMGVDATADLLRERADEIEDAFAVRWNCGAKVSEPHVPGCNCAKPDPV